MCSNAFCDISSLRGGGGCFGKLDPMRGLGLLLRWMSQFVESKEILIFCGFSLEGVNVVLQMLDLLCKLKNDVKGLKVYRK